MRRKLTSPERDALYLEDIVDSTVLIETYLKGVKLPDFTANTPLGNEKVDCVSRRLIIIGEAVKSLSEPTLRNLREDHPDIQWSDIAKLKDRLSHHYWTIDLRQLWEIAKVHVPILKRAVEPVATAAQKQKREGK